MAASDVVAQLSAWENCSYTLLDAVVRGLRVVASDVGGNAEIVPADALVPEPIDPAVVAEKLLEGGEAASAASSQIDAVAAMTARLGAMYDT